MLTKLISCVLFCALLMLICWPELLTPEAFTKAKSPLAVGLLSSSAMLCSIVNGAVVLACAFSADLSVLSLLFACTESLCSLVL